MSARVELSMPREMASGFAEALGRAFVALNEKADRLRASDLREAGRTRAAGREVLLMAAALSHGYTGSSS
jgi:hypothetical protein